jgi:hypothetical protein
MLTMHAVHIEELSTIAPIPGENKRRKWEIIGIVQAR